MNLKKVKGYLGFKKMEKEGCPLCRLVEGEIKTHKYYRDVTCIIVDCLTCRIPMVVVNHHGQATEEDKRLMVNAIDYLFEYHSIRRVPRQIVDHEHWHVIGARLKKA